MALTLETRRVSKGVRYPENKRTPLLTRRVTFLKSVPLRVNRYAIGVRDDQCWTSFRTHASGGNETARHVRRWCDEPSGYSRSRRRSTRPAVRWRR